MKVPGQTRVREDTFRILEQRLPAVVRTDRLELIMLRVSVAQACGGVGVETRRLRVVGKSLQELVWMANHNERGWNTLLAMLVEKVVGHQ
jgi:hypothetical protein